MSVNRCWPVCTAIAGAVALLTGQFAAAGDDCDPPVLCPPEAELEGEPVCHDEYEDHFNGGCGAFPPVYSIISCDEVVCGEGGNFLSQGSQARDTDWYEMDMPHDGTIHWTGRGELPLLLVILDAGGGCEQMHIIASATADTCQSGTASVEVEAGQYWLWIGSSAFEGFPCGSKYVVEVSCENQQPCIEDLDLDESVGFGDLIILLSSWQKTGTPADLDGSGVVDFADLLMLLAAWGACP